MAEKKQSVLALLDVLRRCSDEEHPLTVNEIKQHLENEYDLTLERRTIYSNIELLSQNGYEVSTYEDNRKGYFLLERQFDKGEVLLLCNAIHASHFISNKQSDELISKLLSTQSKYQAKEFQDKVYMANPLKTPNKQLLYTIETVSMAIRDHKKLQFIYQRYNKEKKLVPRRDEPYIVEPRYIVYADSRAYMIVTSANHDGFIHYRLDRMKDALILNEKVRPLPKDVDAYEYARNKLFMYTGEMNYVTFLCKNSIMDQMIDIFGPGLNVFGNDQDHFMITVKTSHTGAIYLAQQFMDSITIISPADLREEFRNKLKEVAKNYR